MNKQAETTYTLADLLAMDSDALNAMAAELRGWQLESGAF